MISDARGSHVSPGIYTEERDVAYSVKSLGITSLGLVGETLYGPAFQNIEIENWGEFVDYFGGTSAEKFKETGLPKYELPYVAKSYLEESKRLNVVRVLGLSGYKAGKAWVIKNAKDKPAIILRSKMSYTVTNDNCGTNGETPKEIVDKIEIGEYKDTKYNSVCGSGSNNPSADTINGKFSINVTCKSGCGYANVNYNVSLNPSDSDYIYNVISKRPDTGTTPIYIDAIYESNYDYKSFTPTSGSIISAETETGSVNTYYEVVDTKVITVSGETSGETFESSAYTYTLEECEEKYGSVLLTGGTISGNVLTHTADLQLNTGMFVYSSASTNSAYSYTDFTEGYRAAQTPWIVSDALINSGNTEITSHVRKLFRFITISDGDAANFQVKVSIENINIEEGYFDVVVRDFYDTDANPIILEKFVKCNLVEGDVNYIAFKIGSADGGYESKSKYILVKMADGEDFGKSIPAGFLGYPMPKYGCTGSTEMKYNVKYRPEIKAKKQYFGISNLEGIDTDIFAYKGKDFYSEKPDTLTTGFHMDSVIGDVVYVDGVKGYKFEGVSKEKVSNTTFAPRFAKVDYINNTIYGDAKLRKFTVCFFGGFDGWDVNRTSRTNTDKYKSTKYTGSNGIFSKVEITNDLNLPVDLPMTAITSDYYAYLAGCRIFANPQDIDINIFATPGINWKDNTLLTEEIIDIIEDGEDGRGGDALYVMASPNAVDAKSVAQDFKDLDINSSYACTYFPWVTYYDKSNKRYLDLPTTKDVVRNMAATDNTSFPWFAPAGMQRGNVDCIKAMFKTTLADEDALYEVGINPIKTYARDGVKVWGNKTAYDVESPINRINVRRLMIRIKKLVTEAAKSLIFEQYDETLEKQFRGIVEPILADVKSNRGIIDYRVITESTPETRDQHILPAKILIKPTQALEYISISFVVYPESVSFDE